MGAMMWPEAVPEAEGRGHRPRAYFFSPVKYFKCPRPQAEGIFLFFFVIFILPRALFIQLVEYFLKKLTLFSAFGLEQSQFFQKILY